jgi:hypothetical protein
MVLLKKYGEAPVRVVRKSDPGEHGHQRFYDRLGYIYVYSGHVDPTDDDTASSPEERRRLFLDAAGRHLREGRNIVICPEGTSTETERSPLPFKAGAFHLAAGVRPEPLIVPIAVANFDKKITRTKTATVVHEPFRISDHLGENVGKEALRGFVNDVIYARFRATSVKPWSSPAEPRKEMPHSPDRPALTRPPGFGRFWARTRAELGEVAPAVVREHLGSEDPSSPSRSSRSGPWAGSESGGTRSAGTATRRGRSWCTATGTAAAISSRGGVGRGQG